MRKQSGDRMAVKRAEGAWDSSGRIGSGAASAPGNTGEQVPAWPWDPVLEGARRQLDQYLSLEPKVLKGRDPDAIHDIRVASRRLQQVLDLLYPAPRPAKVQKVRRTIRRSRRVLSVVRNCDVLLERTERILARKRASRREVWSAFRDYIEERRERSFRKATRRLSKLNLSALYVRLQEQMRPPDPSPSEETSLGGARTAPLRPRINQSLQETWSSLAICVEQARETPDTASLHAVRIAAKKVRYLVEVVHALDVPGSDQTLACLRRLQTHLGDWHDLEVLEEMMLAMVAQPEFLAERLEVAMEVERLDLRNRKSKFGYVEQFLRMTGSSEEWVRLTGWVRDFLASGEVSERDTGKESQSPALAP